MDEKFGDECQHTDLHRPVVSCDWDSLLAFRLLTVLIQMLQIPSDVVIAHPLP